MAIKFEFLYENREPVKQFDNEVLDEDKIRAIYCLKMNDIITLGNGSDKVELQVIKIKRVFNAAETHQGEDSMYFEFTVKALPKTS